MWCPSRLSKAKPERQRPPTYKDYLPVTGGLTGQSDYVTADGESMKLSYYSDPATSQLESHFSLKTHLTVAEQWKNNGMVHSDKSVIYGDDDYGAFDSYDDNLFAAVPILRGLLEFLYPLQGHQQLFRAGGKPEQ